MSEEVRALDVEVHGSLEIRFFSLLERSHQRYPCVRDQDVDFAAPGNRLGDQALDVFDVACVRFYGDGVIGPDLLDKFLGGLGVGGVVDDYFGAEGCEFQRCCGADAF